MSDGLRFLVVVGLALVIGLVVACGSQAAASPNGPPEPTTAATGALTVSSDTEGDSVIQRLASRMGLGSEREEIVAFTREALQIEATRNRGVECFATAKNVGLFGLFSSAWLLNGLRLKETEVCEVFEGVASLHGRLLLLPAPQVLEPVKDSLAEVYAREVQIVRDQLHLDQQREIGFALVMPTVTKDNIDTIKQEAQYEGAFSRLKQLVESPWARSQELRKQIYDRWAEILQEHNIDAAEEGFTELVSQ